MDFSPSSRLTTVLAEDAEVLVELVRKKSRFLTVMRRVAHQDEAQALVDRLRRENHTARHHCSAWVLGADRALRRAHDDGEPAGTAGAPMLEALTHAAMPGGHADLTDVVAVVIRWFGGTLLGAGGLVSAYSASVTTAVKEAEARGLYVQRRRMRHLRLRAPIAVAGRWENELRTGGTEVIGTDYGTEYGTGHVIADDAVLRLAVDDTTEALEDLAGRIAVVTSGEAVATEDGTGWMERRS